LRPEEAVDIASYGTIREIVAKDSLLQYELQPGSYRLVQAER